MVDAVENTAELARVAANGSVDVRKYGLISRLVRALASGPHPTGIYVIIPGRPLLYDSRSRPSPAGPFHLASTPCKPMPNAGWKTSRA